MGQESGHSLVESYTQGLRRLQSGVDLGCKSHLGAVERIHFLMVVLAATGAEGKSSLLLAVYWLEVTLESRGHQQLTQWMFAFSRLSGESLSL